MPIQKVSRKRKFVADGVFYAELNDVFYRMLGFDGYTGLQVRRSPVKTEIVIRCTRPVQIMGEKGRRLRELTSLVQSRFNLPEGTVEIYVESVKNRALSAIAQCESLFTKLAKGQAVRRAVYAIMRYVMEAGGKGIEVVVSGKLRVARAKSQKFRDGYMIKSGNGVNHYVDQAHRHLKLKAGVLGMVVKIMKPYDPTGRNGVAVKPADVVTIHMAKE
jgi:small subunit ribosomal protein S3e